MSSCVKRCAWTFLIPIAFGIAAFILVVGINPLNPTNIAWLSGQDPSQHYLGWSFFRQTPWTNPIGLNPNYGLDISNSIVFSDSIPWMAFLFKVISDFLPDPFQYIGLWVLICFILQSWFSWKLAGLITQDLRLRFLICGLLGIFAPPFLKRLGLHAALMGQFLILAGLYLNLCNQNCKKIGLAIASSWLILLSLAALTNFYLLIMVIGLWLAFICDRLLTSQTPFSQVATQNLVISAVVFFCLWQAGYFANRGAPIQAEGFGQYKVNLLSLFDAGRYSYFIKPIPHLEDLEEGFVFFGSGLLSLLIIYFFCLIRSTVFMTKHMKQTNLAPDASNQPKAEIRPALSACLIFFAIFSLSNQISIGSWTWSYSLPASILDLASILRSSGRLFWPVYYALVFLLLRWVANHFSNKNALIILSTALAIQVIDTSAGWLPLKKTFLQLSENQSPPILSGPFWDAAGKRYAKVVIWPLHSKQAQDNWQALSYFASSHHMGTNAVYLGRRADPLKVELSNKAIHAQIETQQLLKDTLYVFSDTPRTNDWLAHQTIKPENCVNKINGFIVIGSDWPECKLPR